ncbi:WG repeat-containing protein [Aureibaculum sp. A20]|uniref:WG repeat-containing protein n=1 Tax=Aureibaculum flavum TaxID=2795986 RepID=A0ABS0WT35_9FLAO|nr:WG repeat-containing protein [Aureibaculum flavum]MBJ2175145.1 WG repeat-containing protein [Aureibaculum flavum]
MDRLDFGKKLIRIRKAKGLTQAEVAEKCNITIRTIQRIESGTVKPRSSTIKIISEFLEVDFFENSIQNSDFKNHTVLWYLKDIFNLKTNTMKKISILSASLFILTFIGINIFSTEAQSKSPNKQEEVILESQNKKINFSKEFDEFKVEGNFVFVTKNNKHGLMNLDGETIIPCEYDMFEVENNYVLTLKGNKRGLMNLDGKTIIPCEYDMFEVENNYVLTLKGNKRGLMNLDGKTIIPCEYDMFEVENNYVLTLKGNKRGLMNLDGKTIIPCEYDTMKFEEGVAIVTKNGKTKQIRI